MATPIKSLFPPIEKKPFLLNKYTKKKAGAIARRRVSTFILCFLCLSWLLIIVFSIHKAMVIGAIIACVDCHGVRRDSEALSCLLMRCGVAGKENGFGLIIKL